MASAMVMESYPVKCVVGLMVNVRTVTAAKMAGYYAPAKEPDVNPTQLPRGG